jgi:uncharacterized protein
VKIEINRIPPEGLILSEEISPSFLDLDTGIVRFRGKLKIRAEISKDYNVVGVHLDLGAIMSCSCSRCLGEFESELNKELDLNYPVDKLVTVIDLDPEIREEIILDCPVKPLCTPDCKGLCPKCGENLNEGGCSCATT